MKIGMIGLGHMGLSLLTGMAANRENGMADFIASAHTKETMKQASDELGVKTATNVTVAKTAGIVFLAVRPSQLAEVIAEIKDVLLEKTVVVSVAAGKSLAEIEEMFGRKVKLVRIMPNLAVTAGEGVIGLTYGDGLTAADKTHVSDLLDNLGMVCEIPESQMDIIGALAGSSPAWTYMYIDALANAGVRYGLSKGLALNVVIQSIIGATELSYRSGELPANLIDLICSPGGTTIEGVKVLDELGFKGTVMDAVEACMNKTKGL